MAVPDPSVFKNLIPGATSSLCEKLNKLMVGLTTAAYNWVAFEYNPDGASLTDEYIALLCAARCNGPSPGGGGTTNPNMPTPTGVSASDGTYTSKVRVIWNEVTPPSGGVTNYLVYRSSSTNTDPTAATLIATVGGTTFSYDDTTTVAGITYNYWVRATNGTDNSAFGGPDTGYATTFAPGFPIVTDLKASQGFSDTTAGFIALVFNPPIGTTAIDVYRNTTNDSSTAVLIHSDVVCNDTLSGPPTVASGNGANNYSGYVIWDEPPSGSTKYFYWVKVKTDAPPQISDFSNSAEGWVQIGTGDAGATNHQLITANSAVIIPVGCNFMRVVLVGGGGAGAGASSFYGGGGGGSGDTLMGVIPVVPLDPWTYSQIFFVNGASAFGNPPAANPLSGAYAYEGKSSKLSRDSDSKYAISLGGGNGLYSSSGGGSGGVAPGTSGFDPAFTTTEEILLKGKAGESAVGSRGGRSGEPFGSYSTPPAHYLGGSFNGNGLSGAGGGGSSVASAFTGGSNGTGYLVVCFYP
jgi:hypothetical protein